MISIKENVNSVEEFNYLKELRHHKYDINEKFDDFDDYE